MRKGLLAALATAAVMNGCTTTPYGYEPGPPPFRHYGETFVPPMPAPRDAYPADTYRDRRADREDRRRDRMEYDRCRSDDPRDCTPPPDFFVQPLPPDYPGPDHAKPDYAKLDHARKQHPAQAVAARDGQWRVQLGAFRQQSRAAILRTCLAGSPALASYRTYLVIGGGVTRVQAGPLPNAAAASQLCARVKTGGHACIVKRS